MDSLQNKNKWYRGSKGWSLKQFDHPELGEVTGYVEAEEGDPFWDEDSGLEYLKMPLTRREVAEDTLGEEEFGKLRNQFPQDKHQELWDNIASRHERDYAMGTMFGPDKRKR